MPPLLPALLTLACAPESSEQTQIPWDDLQSAVDAAARDNDARGGVILRVQTPDGAVLWEGAAGLPWRGSEQAMAPQFTFEIASITKTFTATTALLLAEEGALDLDAPLSAYLPAELTRGLLVIDGHDHGPELTPRQLLAHDSGLPDYWTDPPFVTPGVNAFLAAFIADADRLWTPAELIDYARALAPISAPGGGFHYADTNYVLLGLLIEAIEGAPLHEVLRDRLLTPLSLDATYLSYHEAPASNVTESHRYEGREDLYGQRRQSADWAGGGLVSDAADLGTFFGALADDGVFADPTTSAAMRTVIPTDWGDEVFYGLGLIEVELDDGAGALWGHEGYGGSFAYSWPEQDLLFLGTVNQTNADPWPLIGAALALVP